MNESQRKVVWVQIPLSPAEIKRILKKYPKAMTPPGTFSASIRQYLGFNHSPVGFNSYEHIRVLDSVYTETKDEQQF